MTKLRYQVDKLALPPDVQRVLHTLTHNTSEPFTFDRLRGDIECRRNKPLLIETDAMPLRMSGYVVALQDVDLVCTRRGMNVLLTRTTTLHEMSHLLLDHLPLLTNGAATPSYAEFIQKRDFQAALYRDPCNAYASPHEYAAEALATLLYERILTEEQAIPPFLRSLYE